MSFLNAECVLAVLVDLTLVVVIVDLLQLLAVRSGGVYLLHYVLLLCWDAVFEIYDVVLVLKVI